MADAYKEIARQLAILRELGSLATSVAPLVAREVRKDILEHVKDGVDPEGKPWKKTKDGHTPLQNTDENLRVRVFGSRVVATLEGRHARHHLGAVSGRVQRKILPTRSIPDTMARAIKRVADAEFRKIVR